MATQDARRRQERRQATRTAVGRPAGGNGHAVSRAISRGGPGPGARRADGKDLDVGRSIRAAPPAALGPRRATLARRADAPLGRARDAARRTLTWLGRRAGVVGDACADAPPPPGALLRLALAIEVCLFGLIVITPLGGIAQNVSPLARAWPWVFIPAHLAFPELPLHVSSAPEHNRSPWPAFDFTALLVIASAIAALAVVRCLREQGSRRRHLALVLGAAAVMGLTLVLLPSLPSDDVFSYIVYGRISAIHHANPLVTVPARFPHDPFLSFVYWVDVRSVYGPIWLFVSAELTQLAEALGGALATYVLLFKLFALLCHLVNAALIWAILGRLAPRRRLLGTILYAWCPLCLLEFCASAHNDALMLSFLLGGVLLLTRRQEVPALAAFGLSIATKYVPLALLPLYLFAVARPLLARAALALRGALAAPASRRGWAPPGARIVREAGAPLRAAAWAIGWRLGIVMGVVVALTLPFWDGPATVKAVLYSPPAERLDNSWQEAISWPLRWAIHDVFGLGLTAAAAEAETALKALALIAFALLWLRQFRRARGLTGTLRAWAWVLLWYVLVASGWFWPWYVTWLVVVVALLPWSELSVTTLLLAGGVLVLYAFRPLNYHPLYGDRALFSFGPAVAYLLVTEWRRRRARAPVPQLGVPVATPGAVAPAVASGAIAPVDVLPSEGRIQLEGAPSGR